MARYAAAVIVLLAAFRASEAVYVWSSVTDKGPAFSNTTNNGTFWTPLRAPDARVVKTAGAMAPEQIKLTYWAPGQMLVSWVTGGSIPVFAVSDCGRHRSWADSHLYAIILQATLAWAGPA
jgi:hypothetical protein